MLTLVIPTRNRAHFLSRVLHYYSQNQLKYSIIIADASDPEDYNKTEQVIKRLDSSLNVIHLPFPAQAPAFVCLANGLKQVRTPYSVFVADDDFYVPAALDQCVRFLETHPDYRVVHGIHVIFGLASGIVHGPIQWVFHYNYGDIEQDSGTSRFGDYIKDCFSTDNSVHRTEDLLEGYEQAVKFNMDDQFKEILTSCLPVIRGKVKRIEKLYKICQGHAQQLSCRLAMDAIDRICMPRWAEHYSHLRDYLGEILARQDGISVKEGREIVKKGFWLYLARGLDRDWQLAYSPQSLNGLRPRVQGTLQRILGILKTRYRIFSFIPSQAIEISLSELLTPSSPYHSDFAPVYRAITSESGPSWTESGSGSARRY